MADILTGYGTSGQVITITLTSLADSSTAGRESTSVSNTSDKFLDVLIQGKVKPQNSGSIAAPSAASCTRTRARTAAPTGRTR